MSWMCAGHSAGNRADVLVAMEDVVRVVTCLDAHEALVVVPVGRWDTSLAFVVVEEVHVHATRRVGLQGAECRAAPLDVGVSWPILGPCRADVDRVRDDTAASSGVV